MSRDDRYDRQTLLPEIGEAGQARLGHARLLCVGAGGLGCAALPYLAGAGVGRITIVEPDRVERTNLQRQVLFRDAEVGAPKADAAARRLRELNPEIEVMALEERLDADNVERLLREHDAVLDGSDNSATKYLLGDAAVKFDRPLVYAAATGMEAMVTVLDSRHGPCLRCLFPEPAPEAVPNCAQAGVLGPLVGMAGCVQAAEAVKLLSGGGESASLESLAGRLWILDARDMSSRQLQVARREDCATCSLAPEAIRLPEDSEGEMPGIDAQAAAALEDVLFIDVREPDELTDGYIPGAVNLPLSSIGSEAPALPGASHYVVYCARGPRSITASRLLAEAGIAHLSYLRGGIQSWRDAVGHGELAGEGPGEGQTG